MCLFDLGRVEVTPAASATLSEAGVGPSVHLAFHERTTRVRGYVVLPDHLCREAIRGGLQWDVK
jgi:hypothetical protein